MLVLLLVMERKGGSRINSDEFRNEIVGTVTVLDEF